MFLQKLARQVERAPRAPALDAPSGRIDYAQLWGRLQRCGALLAERGAGPEGIVAVALARSADLVVAELGSWHAGAAFLPLDPQQPPERLRALCERAGARLLIAGPILGALAAELGMERLDPAAWRDAPPAPRPRAPAGDAGRLAYLIFSSGTTGRPKGVLVEHRGLCGVLEDQVVAFGLGPGKRALWLLAPVFDASLSDIGTALLSGACLVIRSPEELALPRLQRTFHEARVTHCDLPPRMLPLLEVEALPGCLETLVIGGEVADPAAVRRLAGRLRVVNVYGPTEATICVSLTPCDAEAWGAPVIGEPIGGARFVVLDAGGDEVSSGEAGELGILGPTLARGYLSEPALTARRFVDHKGERLYLSGDRVVREPGGLRFLGRVDRQLKRSGVLVCPEEIEAALGAAPGVAEAAVFEQPSAGGARILTAVVCPESVALEAVRQTLAERLPAALWPQRFVLLGVLPRGPTGKVELERLAAAVGAPRPAGSARGSRGALEARLLSLWRAALEEPELGLEDRPRSFGADSLMAMELAVALEAEGLRVAPMALAGPGNVAEMVAGAEGLARSAAGLDEQAALPAALAARAAAARPAGTAEAVAEPLVTGGTGFLGARVLARLLGGSARRVHALVRAPDQAAGAARLRAALGALADPPSQAQLARLVAHPGELTAPRLGLAPSVYDELTARCDRVFHAAARVHDLASFDELRGVNLDALCGLLDFSLSGRPKVFHDASTLSVFVGSDRDRGLALEDDALDETRRLYGGYAQSKWAAERRLRRAAPGLALVITRFGLLTPDSRNGAAGPTDALGRCVRGLARLGCTPSGCDALEVDVTPVDHAAKAFVALAERGAPAGCYHVANPQPLRFGALLEALAAAGLELERRPPGEVIARALALAAGRGGASAASAVLALCRALEPQGFALHRSLDLFQATGIRFDMRRSRSALGRAWTLPAPRGALLAMMVSSWLESGGEEDRR